MKPHLPAWCVLLIFLVVVGVSVDCGSRLLDYTILLGLYGAGGAILVAKTLVSRPGDRKRHLGGGELALLPESWRRWLLDEKEHSAHK